MRGVGVLLLVLGVAGAGQAQELRILTANEQVTLRDSSRPERTRVRFQVRRDPLLTPLADPSCPTASSVEILTFVGIDLVYGPRIELPCEGWTARGAGHVYRDPAGHDGPVELVRYTDRALSVSLRGVPVTPGPVGFVQMRLWIGDERFLIRTHEFQRNQGGTIVGRRPRPDAAAGETAFWATLGGDASRWGEAVALLRAAADRDANDGRSRFLLGMLHLYRFGQIVDWTQVSGVARAEVAAARAALEAAEPLLWDGAVGDNRVPGFVAAAVYQYGIAHGDAAEAARGLALLEAAVALNPFFNNFDLFSAAPVLAPDDPLFQRIVALVDEALTGPTAACVVTQPDFCANEGLAPHNLEGSLVLFGDLYAKAGRRDDAALLYRLAVATGSASGWPYLDQAVVRRDEVDARIGLFRNGDPGDDPAIFGMNAAACVGCHAR